MLNDITITDIYSHKRVIPKSDPLVDKIPRQKQCQAQAEKVQHNRKCRAQVTARQWSVWMVYQISFQVIEIICDESAHENEQ
jgi:hypothetical protein